MIKCCFAITAILTLTACVSAEDRAAQARNEQIYEQNRQAAYRDGLRARCESYGFRQGTESHSNCLMQLDQARRSQNDATSDAALMMLLRQRQQQSAPRY